MSTERPWIGYACAVTATGLCTLAGFAMTPRFDIVNIAMVYLLAVVVIALRFRRGPAVACAALGVAAFDVLFVPPAGTLSVDDAQYLLTFAIMLAVALVISGLMESRRRQVDARAALAIEAETARLRNTLLASISHDLRTPLAVIAGASSGLVERGERMSASERAALARSIYDTACDVSGQMGKILEMTRIEAGALVPDRDWVALPEIAATVLARLSAHLAGHRVMVDFPADLPLVRADAVLIEHALANLVENAARHTPPGTAVRLHAATRNGSVVVTVEDRGPEAGTPDPAQLFGKFQRGVRTPGAGTSGVGLGLSIGRAIAQLHGGDLTAEAVPGGGLAFHFTLPLEPAPGPPPEALAD